MPYPPSVPAGTRINTTPQVDTHPADHNTIHAALTDIINVLGADPAGASSDVDARFTLVDPPGVIKMYGGTSAPAGYALCDGTAILRATYPALFAAIGTNFGVGDGSTTFNLPNLLSRFPVGKGAATWSDSLNDSGGQANAIVPNHTHAGPSHTHSGPSHTHGFTTGGESAPHYHTYGNIVPGGSVAIAGGGTFSGSIANTSNDIGDHTHSGTTNADGTGATGAAGTGSTGGATDGEAVANKNLPPYLTVNFIIRLS